MALSSRLLLLLVVVLAVTELRADDSQSASTIQAFYEFVPVLFQNLTALLDKHRLERGLAQKLADGLAGFFTKPAVQRLWVERNLEDLQTDTGRSFLTIAAEAGHVPLVRAVLDAGGLVDIRDEEGKTAFTIARERSNKNIRAMIEAHESMTCSDNGLAYILGSVKYDSCRQQQCCHGIWRNTGLALASCGTPCNTPGTRLGTCVLVGECVRLEQVFLVTNAAGDVGRTTKFLVDHRCDTREGSVYVCCPKA